MTIFTSSSSPSLINIWRRSPLFSISQNWISCILHSSLTSAHLILFSISSRSFWSFFSLIFFIVYFLYYFYWICPFPLKIWSIHLNLFSLLLFIIEATTILLFIYYFLFFYPFVHLNILIFCHTHIQFYLPIHYLTL